MPICSLRFDSVHLKLYHGGNMGQSFARFNCQSPIKMNSFSIEIKTVFRSLSRKMDAAAFAEMDKVQQTLLIGVNVNNALLHFEITRVIIATSPSLLHIGFMAVHSMLCSHSLTLKDPLKYFPPAITLSPFH